MYQTLNSIKKHNLKIKYSSHHPRFLTLMITTINIYIHLILIKKNFYLHHQPSQKLLIIDYTNKFHHMKAMIKKLIIVN